MRIAIFSDNFFPEISGISDSIILIAEGLAKLGHKVDFYVPAYSKKNYKKVGLEKKEINLGENIKIYRFFSFPFASGTGQARLVIPSFWRFLKIKKNLPDIIYTELPFGVGLEALTASKILKIPLVGTNHTAITEFIKKFPLKSRYLENLSLKFMSWYYNRCDYVTTPAKFIYEEMKTHGFKRPHEVISNAIDLNIFTTLNQAKIKIIKEKYNFNNHTLIYAGRLAKEKSVDIVFRALSLAKKKIPDITLALAGHGSDEQNLKKLAKELKIENNVRFLGTLDKNELNLALNASDIFVTASTSEVQPMTILQAYACSIPAIGVNINTMPEIINGQNGLLSTPGDYTEMSEKIIDLLENKEKRNKMGKYALDFVKNYSVEYISKEWEAIFNKIKK